MEQNTCLEAVEQGQQGLSWLHGAEAAQKVGAVRLLAQVKDY